MIRIPAPESHPSKRGSLETDAPELGRFPGEGNGKPLQFPCLENPVDRGARRSTVYGGPKSWDD